MMYIYTYIHIYQGYKRHFKNQTFYNIYIYIYIYYIYITYIYIPPPLKNTPWKHKYNKVI